MSKPNAVRQALENLNEDSRRPSPLTSEEALKIGEAAGWRVIVEPWIPKYLGQVVVEGVGQIDEAERILSQIGRILHIGCFCFKSVTQSGLDLSKMDPMPQVGELWLFDQYAGMEIKLRRGNVLRLLTDTELAFKVHDPDAIKGYL